jgi:hypothetical protein
LTTIEELRDIAGEKRANWTLEETESKCRGAWSKRETLQRTRTRDHLLECKNAHKAKQNPRTSCSNHSNPMLISRYCACSYSALRLQSPHIHCRRPYPTRLFLQHSVLYNFRFLVPPSNFNKWILGKRRSMPLEGSLHQEVSIDSRINRGWLHRNSNGGSEDSSQELQGQIHRSMEAS